MPYGYLEGALDGDWIGGAEGEMGIGWSHSRDNGDKGHEGERWSAVGVVVMARLRGLLCSANLFRVPKRESH